MKNLKRKLPNDTKEKLQKRLTKKESRDAVFMLEDGKSPGWDGLPYEFYKFFWNRLEEMFIIMQETLLNIVGRCTDTQRKSVITLLFKGGDPKNLDNWRPVSLLCTDYKIMSKIIANRLKNVLGLVINEDQTCAIPGRSIFSNLFLTRRRS